MSTLLVSVRGSSWREWLKKHRRSRDLLILDPADPEHGTPGRLVLQRGDKALLWRFAGTLEPTRNPLAFLSAAANLAPLASEDAIVLFFEVRFTPVLRQLALAVAQLLRSDEILIPDGCGFEGFGWPVGPQRVGLEPAFPEVVAAAQRRSRWIEMLERCEAHEVPLDRVSIEGLRLGGGLPIPIGSLHLAGVQNALHAEVFGSTLFLVARDGLDQDHIGRALDLTHASAAMVVEPSSYSGLLCSFADQLGDDFGMGMVEEIDFERRLVRAKCTAVAPAPVRILKIGSLRIDAGGKELGETKPWSA
ncbi:MAG TPA: hypothetical protein PLL78_03285 [Fimbriimonadaceae bacterium]|nr:hypothetical protein [Fimbriimonadaceae bacterium]HRJ95683.1 hypothetical protein [Fimbriimonadaceae bacterium]